MAEVAGSNPAEPIVLFAREELSFEEKIVQIGS